MELDATPITGTWMHSLLLDTIVDEQLNDYVAVRIHRKSVTLQYEEHERGGRF